MKNQTYSLSENAIKLIAKLAKLERRKKSQIVEIAIEHYADKIMKFVKIGE